MNIFYFICCLDFIFRNKYDAYDLKRNYLDALLATIISFRTENLQWYFVTDTMLFDMSWVILLPLVLSSENSSVCLYTTVYRYYYRRNKSINALLLVFQNGQVLYQSVQCFPVASLLLSLNVTKVDFFSLDVEGKKVVNWK